MTKFQTTPHEDQRLRAAHDLMEQALVLLDELGQDVAAAHLDHAICALGLPRTESSPSH